MPDTVATKGFSLHIHLAGEPRCLQYGHIRAQPQLFAFVPRLKLLTPAQVKRSVEGKARQVEKSKDSEPDS